MRKNAPHPAPASRSIGSGGPPGFAPAASCAMAPSHHPVAVAHPASALPLLTPSALYGVLALVHNKSKKP